MDSKTVIVEMPLSKLKMAAHNPHTRTNDMRKIMPLQKSMAIIGLIYPILIDKTGTIIEGHRRFTAAKNLKWKTIATVTTDKDPDQVYAMLNATSMKMSGNEVLAVWLKNPEAVTPRVRKKMENIEKMIGRILMQKLCIAGLSARAYGIALRVARYCDADTPENIKMTLEWLMKFSMIYQVRKAMEDGQSPQVIMKGIKSSRPIKLKLAVA